MPIIQHLKIIARTPALRLAVRAHWELLEAGMTDEVSMVGSDHQAILATVSDIPAGVITFTQADWAQQYDIWLGYVVPAYRRQGLYRTMWDALVVRAREAGMKVIMANTAMENVGMRATAKALGRTEVGVLLRYDLKDADQ